MLSDLTPATLPQTPISTTKSFDLVKVDMAIQAYDSPHTKAGKVETNRFGMGGVKVMLYIAKEEWKGEQ